jgi:hypothetical protein
MANSDTHDARAYVGPERRRNRVFVTRNSEYLCRDGRCIAVRDRHTGAFTPDHPAIGKLVSGGIRFSSEGGVLDVSARDALVVGQQVCFSTGDGDLEHDVVTSSLLAVERLPKELAARDSKLWS